MASTFFVKPFVTIPVAASITVVILHFVPHIRYISVYPLLYFSFLLPFA
jgi:hypothetical protein